MGRVIKWLFFVIVLGFVGIVGYAFLGDLSAPQTTQTRQVTIEVD